MQKPPVHDFRVLRAEAVQTLTIYDFYICQRANGLDLNIVKDQVPLKQNFLDIPMT